MKNKLEVAKNKCKSDPYCEYSTDNLPENTVGNFECKYKQINTDCYTVNSDNTITKKSIFLDKNASNILNSL